MEKKSLLFKILIPVVAIAVFIGVFLAVGLNPTYGDNFVGGNSQEVSNTAASTPTVTISNTNFSGGTKHIVLKEGEYYKIENCTFQNASGASIEAESGVQTLDLVGCTIKNNGCAIDASLSSTEVTISGGTIEGNDTTTGDFYQGSYGTSGDAGIYCDVIYLKEGVVIKDDMCCESFNFYSADISGNVACSYFEFYGSPTTTLNIVPTDLDLFADGADLGCVSSSNLNLKNVRLFYEPSWSDDLPAASNGIGVTGSGSTLYTYWDRYKVKFHGAGRANGFGTAVEVIAGTTFEDAFNMYLSGDTIASADAPLYSAFLGTIGGFGYHAFSNYFGTVITEDTDIFGYFDGTSTCLFDGFESVPTDYFERIRQRELWVATERELTLNEAKLILLLEEFIFNTHKYVDGYGNIDFDSLFSYYRLGQITDINKYTYLNSRPNILINSLTEYENSPLAILEGIVAASADDMGVDPQGTWDLYFPYVTNDEGITNYTQLFDSPTDYEFADWLLGGSYGFINQVVNDLGDAVYVDQAIKLAYNNITGRMSCEFYVLCPDDSLDNMTTATPEFYVPDFDESLITQLGNESMLFHPYSATANPSSPGDVESFISACGVTNNAGRGWGGCIASTDFLFIFECYRYLKNAGLDIDFSKIYSSSFLLSGQEFTLSWSMNTYNALNFYQYVWACDVQTEYWDTSGGSSFALSMSDLVSMFMSKLCISSDFQAFEEARARLVQEARNNGLGLSEYALWEVLSTWLPFSEEDERWR